MKSNDLRMAELEELFGCTIGENLTDELGQDLWWYRIFVYLAPSELSKIMLTCRYFYYMKVYHELVHDHIITISSLPALLWKLTILKDFKIEEKFKKSMNYIRICFMSSMDWTAKLPAAYLSGFELIRLPDTKQIYIEYLSLNANNLDDEFIKMTNLMFQALFENMRSSNYVELINKTGKEFTWKLQSFNNMISSLFTVTRLRVPCWHQDLFTPQMYSLQSDAMRSHSMRNLEYIHVTEMRFENFAALLPNDNGGIHAVEYSVALQKLKGIIFIFAEETSKKQQEMESVAESMLTVLEMESVRDNLQYFVFGVNRLRSTLFNPFQQYDMYDELTLKRYDTEYAYETNTLPMNYQLFEFNYMFKHELNNIFWRNYKNPDADYKDIEKINMAQRKEAVAKQKQIEQAQMLKSLISMQIQEQQPQALSMLDLANMHAVNPHNDGTIYVHNADDDDDDDDEEEEYYEDESSHSEMRANGNVPQTEVEEKKQENGDDDDVDEGEEDEKKNSREYTLQELGKTLHAFQEAGIYKAARSRPSFIVIYNTQIYVEDKGDEDALNKIPLTTNAAGQWQCPHCTVWNAKFAKKCEMCGKKKTKYIPPHLMHEQQYSEQLKIEQQQQQQQQYMQMDNLYSALIPIAGWKCAMCGAQNDDTLKNCNLCTFERSNDSK
eukprot:CAMPEP_0197029886 /NCGR_PEP_ID=MMETSP1384-20130603/9238_1 /TAXON_ID=29189 /ORGANISM="Ammonia sp." /LENGTH=664 /DNA_ID=CAMNT_0042459129 /DNA_START=1 /DNA_END=1995 /DNA_ORIENTATION=-